MLGHGVAWRISIQTGVYQKKKMAIDRPGHAGPAVSAGEGCVWQVFRIMRRSCPTSVSAALHSPSGCLVCAYLVCAYFARHIARGQCIYTTHSSSNLNLLRIFNSSLFLFRANVSCFIGCCHSYGKSHCHCSILMLLMHCNLKSNCWKAIELFVNQRQLQIHLL